MTDYLTILNILELNRRSEAEKRDPKFRVKNQRHVMWSSASRFSASLRYQLFGNFTRKG